MKSTKVKIEKNDEINIVDIITGNQKMSENEIVELVKSRDSPPPKETVAAKKEREKVAKTGEKEVKEENDNSRNSNDVIIISIDQMLRIKRK